MKAAIVDSTTGELVVETAPHPDSATRRPRRRWPTSSSSWSQATTGRRRLGVAFPSIVHHGVVGLAANIDASWMGVDADALFAEACGLHVDDDQRCRRRGNRRGAIRGGAWPRRCRDHADVRHRDRVRPVHRRHARAEHRTRPPRTRRARRRVAGVGQSFANARASAGTSGRRGSSGTCVTSRCSSRPTCSSSAGERRRSPTQWLPVISIDTEIVPATMANNAGIVGAALVGAGLETAADPCSRGQVVRRASSAR